MNNCAKRLICLVGSLALAAGARTVNNDTLPDGATDENSNPYGAITERNIFDLKPPVVVDNTPTNNSPPVNVKLNGITTIFGNSRGLFTVTEPASPGKPAKDHPYMLSEGQRQETLEVMTIDPKSRTARIKVDGIESTISIETNKVASGGAPAQTLGMPGSRGPGFVPPGAPNSFQKPNFAPHPNPQFQRPVRTSDNSFTPTPTPTYNPQGYANPQSYAGGAAVQTPAGMISLNGVPVGMSPNQTVPANQLPRPSYEEQVTLIEAQRAIAQAQGSPIAAILPPTPMSPVPQQPPQQQQQQQQSSGGVPSLPGAKATGTFAK